MLSAGSNEVGMGIKLRIVVVTVVFLSSAVVLLNPPRTLAAPPPSGTANVVPRSTLHCPPNSPTHIYAKAGRSLASATSEGIRGNIQMTAGNVCESGVSHSVTVCNNGSCSGWVQVGWRYYSNFSSPKAYCERKGTAGSYQLTEYAVANATHHYKWESNVIDEKNNRQWKCYIGGILRITISASTYGFGKGSWMPVQGEAHSAHVQIGMMAPNKLSFSSLNYKNGTSWPALGPTSPAAPAPYGADVPNSSTVRVWTNPH